MSVYTEHNAVRGDTLINEDRSVSIDNIAAIKDVSWYSKHHNAQFSDKDEV